MMNNFRRGPGGPEFWQGPEFFLPEPTTTTLMVASLALSAAGTGASIVGQGQQAAAAAGQANYQAQVARNNQQIMEWNAQRALQQGEADAGKQDLMTAQIEGKQRAALASQGGDVNSGSPLDIVADTARAGYTDAATIRSNAALQAYGYRVQGAGYGGSASNYSAAAANATANLPFGMGSSLLSGASSIGAKYADWLRSSPAGGGSGDFVGGTAP